MKPKSTFLAAVLSLVFGPLGMVYVGWRFAVCSLLVLGVFTLVVSVIGLPIPEWGKYVILPVFAWKAATMASVRNGLDAVSLRQFQTFPVAMMAASDLLVGIAMCFAAAICVYSSVIAMFDGAVLKGLALLVLGTPFLVWMASMVFGFIAFAIDAAVLALAPGTKNLFRTEPGAGSTP